MENLLLKPTVKLSNMGVKSFLSKLWGAYKRDAQRRSHEARARREAEKTAYAKERGRLRARRDFERPSEWDFNAGEMLGMGTYSRKRKKKR